MFKRVEKRRKKIQEEEELGLNEEMKEILGMHDTDSEESDSDSDQSSSNENIEDAENEAGSEASELEELDMGGESEDENPMISVEEALRDPIYLVSTQPDVKACLACPGKLLKSSKMVGLHRKSNAHERRYKQVVEVLTAAKPTENSWDIIRQNLPEKPKASLAPLDNSKRAEKRKARAIARKLKREKRRAKAKAKKAAIADTSMPPVMTSPPKKKRKVDVPIAEAPVSPVPVTENAVQTTIKSIARSTSDRAKLARKRAKVKINTTPKQRKKSL